MKKIISLILVTVVLAVVLVSCGKNTDLIGTWQAKVDLGHAYGLSLIGNDEDATDYINFEEIFVSYILEFKEDGTYRLYITDEDFDAFIATAKQRMYEGYPEYLDVLGLPPDTLGDYGLTVEALVDDLFEDEALTKIKGDLILEGKYKDTDESAFAVSLDAATDADNNNRFDYSLNGDTLTLSGAGFNHGIIPGILPVEFSRK